MKLTNEFNPIKEWATDKGILSKKLTFRLNIAWAFIMATALVIAIFGLTRVSEFLYFQF